MSTIERVWVTIVASTLLLGCSPSGQPTTPASGSRAEPTPPPSRQLGIAIGRGPESLGSLPLRNLAGPAAPTTALRMFNAGLAVNDERELPLPYLAEALPKLNTDSWTVSPDGRMETTYRLKPNLTWHDGAPLLAEDFVFAWQVYSIPELGRSASPPFNSIDDVRAPDPRSVVVSWRQVYADADDLQSTSFPPLPKHILEAVAARRDADALVAHPFWTSDYVGLGPFRVTNWELGSFLEGAAFDGHALGKPKIDRVKLLFTTDPNVALTYLLSDTAQIAIDNAIQIEQAATLDREWGAHNGGTVLRSPSAVRGAHFQLRPEFVNPRAALDVRVRRAVAHATDRQSLADGLTDGSGTIADSFLVPQVDYYADVERNVMTYPYDPRQAERLFNEAGFTKGSDGFFASPSEGKFSLEIAVTDANPSEGTIMVDGLRRVGVDANLRVIPRAQTTEPMIFANYPGILNGQLNGAFAPPLVRFRASELPRAENRYLGTNFAGFNNPEFERLATAYESALDRTDRNQQSVKLVTLLSQEVPAYPLFYYQVLVAFAANVRGPVMAVSSASSSWNVHEWSWAK